MHMFYMICSSRKERNDLLTHLKQENIKAVFHYLPLHKSSFFSPHYCGEDLPNSVHFSECIIRLPFFYDLNEEQQMKVIEAVKKFYF